MQEIRESYVPNGKTMQNNNRAEKLAKAVASSVKCRFDEALRRVRTKLEYSPNQPDHILIKRAIYHYEREGPVETENPRPSISSEVVGTILLILFVVVAIPFAALLALRQLGVPIELSFPSFCSIILFWVMAILLAYLASSK